MTEQCQCPPEAGNIVCDAAGPSHQSPSQPAPVCPQCKQTGKPVEGQTVKALLAVSLRAVQDTDYRFCRTPACSVVYFAPDATHHFTTDQLRERIYQKAPHEDSIPVCYCFRHTAGNIRASSIEEQAAIVADITAGIQNGQCACDLRNPQGSCCLGNVRELTKRSGNGKKEKTEKMETTR